LIKTGIFGTTISNINIIIHCIIVHNIFLFSIDATDPSYSPGRYINNDRNGNLKPYVQKIGNRYHICFSASREIDEDDELVYDYGDTRRDVIASNPWLKDRSKVTLIKSFINRNFIKWFNIFIRYCALFI
jgi:hypothetical protein